MLLRAVAAATATARTRIPATANSFSATFFRGRGRSKAFVLPSLAKSPRLYSTEAAAFKFDEGLAVWEEGDVARAMSLFEESISILPTADGYYNLSLCLLSLKRYDEAVAVLRKSVNLDPNGVDSLVALANCLVLLKKPAEAVEHYETAMKLDPSDGEVAFNRACAHDALGDLKSAVEHFRLAVKLGVQEAEPLLRNANAKLLGNSWAPK